MRFLNGKRIWLIVVIPLAVQWCLLGTAAADDLWNFSVRPQSSNAIVVEVHYRYDSPHGLPIGIDVAIFSEGRWSGRWFVTQPDIVNERGPGLASVKVIYGADNPPDTTITDQIKVFMFEHGGTKGEFYSETFNYRYTWRIARENTAIRLQEQIAELERRIQNLEVRTALIPPVEIIDQEFKRTGEFTARGFPDVTQQDIDLIWVQIDEIIKTLNQLLDQLASR
ncbi:hypothetical protein ES703_23997 [subsurface metagenome]